MGTILLAFAVAACSASPGLAGPSGPAGGPTPSPSPASTGGAVPGGWQGTISFHAVVDILTDETTESGDPGSLFHQTTTEHYELRADVTDDFTVSGADGDDVTYGVVEVDLAGQVSNGGTHFERVVYTSDKHNALGCHYLDETGSEISGSWTHGANGHGKIRFSDDGTYTITVGVSGDPATGEMPDSADLPQRLWKGYTILEGAPIDCPPPGYEQKTTGRASFEWASSVRGGTEGSLDPANPGSVVDGSVTFDTTSPDATVTVTWHLVHDGPINLPHN